jgi:hypothetical protein
MVELEQVQRDYGALLGRVAGSYAASPADRADPLQEFALALMAALPRFRVWRARFGLTCCGCARLCGETCREASPAGSPHRGIAGHLARERELAPGEAQRGEDVRVEVLGLRVVGGRAEPLVALAEVFLELCECFGVVRISHGEEAELE